MDDNGYTPSQQHDFDTYRENKGSDENDYVLESRPGVRINESGRDEIVPDRETFVSDSRIEVHDRNEDVPGSMHVNLAPDTDDAQGSGHKSE